jgi:hypothetical protein
MTKIQPGYIKDIVTKEYVLQFPPCAMRMEKVRVCCNGLRSKIKYCNVYRHQVVRECISCAERSKYAQVADGQTA